MINLRKAIKAHLEQGNDHAKEFFDLRQKPSVNFLKTIEHGIEVSQKVVDEYFANVQAPAPEPAANENPKASTDVEVQDDTDEVIPLDGFEAPRTSGSDSLEIIRLRKQLNVPETATAQEVLEAAANGKWKRSALILTPLNRDINPYVHFGIVAQLMRQRWVGWEMEANTVLQRGRNVLANRFLRSTAEWSIWIDGDNVAPWKGCMGTFYKKLGFNQLKVPPKFLDVNAIERAIGHGKTIVGGVYRQRMFDGKLVCQFDLRPRNNRDKELAKTLANGPVDALEKCDYVATGFAAIHRSVYEDIMKKFPDGRREGDEEVPYDFFGHDVGRGGEDIEFCRLAKEAGHQSYLDMALFCAHIGPHSFTP